MYVSIFEFDAQPIARPLPLNLREAAQPAGSSRNKVSNFCSEINEYLAIVALTKLGPKPVSHYHLPLSSLMRRSLRITGLESAARGRDRFEFSRTHKTSPRSRWFSAGRGDLSLTEKRTGSRKGGAAQQHFPG